MWGRGALPTDVAGGPRAEEWVNARRKLQTHATEKEGREGKRMGLGLAGAACSGSEPLLLAPPG